jgi:hypothetical protein
MYQCGSSVVGHQRKLNRSDIIVHLMRDDTLCPLMAEGTWQYTPRHLMADDLLCILMVEST